LILGGNMDQKERKSSWFWLLCVLIVLCFYRVLVRRTWAKSVLPRSRDLGTRQNMEKPVDAWTEKEKEKKKKKHFREEVTSMVEH
jgi:hypothetical protein